MISMTGFGQACFEDDGWRFDLELRTVNSRFLDIKFHLPYADVALEHELREQVQKVVNRGRVDVTIRLSETESAPENRVNLPAAQAIGRALTQLADAVGCDLATAARLIPPQRDLLAIAPDTSSAAKVRPGALRCFNDALAALSKMRALEGDVLYEDLSQLRQGLIALSDQIAKKTEAEPQNRSQRLQQRLAKLQKDIEPERLAQEVALLADRCDVSEELTRLGSHLDQMATLLDEQGPVGRKIEFLLQEINREVNTVASKSGEAEVGSLVVEAKSIVEKMREQSANVE